LYDKENHIYQTRSNFRKDCQTLQAFQIYILIYELFIPEIVSFDSEKDPFYLYDENPENSLSSTNEKVYFLSIF